MAKKVGDDAGEIKKLLGEIYKVVSHFNGVADKQTQINRALLKTMSVVNDGFVKTEKDARSLFSDINGMIAEGVEVTDDFFKTWLKAKGASNDMLDDMIDKFKEIEKIDVETIANSKDYIDLLTKRYQIFEDELDLSQRLLSSHDAITKTILESKKMADRFGGSLTIAKGEIEEMVRRKVDLSGMFGGLNSSIDETLGLVGRIGKDVETMIANVSGMGFEIPLDFNPLTSELDEEVEAILKNVQLEKDARLKGLQEYFTQNDALMGNLSKQIALMQFKSNLELGVEMPDVDMSKFSGLDLQTIELDIDTGQITTSMGILKEGMVEYQELMGKLNSIALDSGITDQLGVGFEQITELIGLSGIRSEEQNAQLKMMLQPLGIATNLLAEQVDLTFKELNANKQLLITRQTGHKALVQQTRQLQDIEKVVQRVGSGFDYINALLPAGISDFLGISKVSGVLMDSHRKGAIAFAKEIQGGATAADAMQSYMKQMGPAIQLALNPATILIGTIALLATFVTQAVDKYKDLTKQMNVSLLQAKQLLDIQLDILTSQKNQFLTVGDIREIQTEMIGSSGKLIDMNTKANKELVIALSESGKAFGYGNEQAVKLHKVFTSIGADDTLAKNLQQNIGLTAELAGLSPQIISSDLIDSAETVSTYFAGMPEQAAKAVLQVRRMGLSLKSAGEVAQRMLDLEGFMTDMYELQAMTGGGIDFSEAFDKGLMGDIEGMTKSIMEEIGTTAEYNNMDYLTRMKIAKTLGMSVDELGRSVKLRESLVGMSDEEKSLVEANLSRMGDISSASQEEIRNRLQQLQATDRLAVAWDKIKGVFVKSILPLVETFANLIDLISPAVDIVVLAFKSIGPVVKLLITPLTLISKLLGGFGDLISMGTSKIDDMSDSVTGLGSYAGGALKILAGLGTIGFGVGLFKSLGFLKNGLFSILEKIPLLGKLFGGIGSVISGMFGGMGKKAANTTTALASSFDGVSSSIKSSMTDMVETVKVAMNKVVEHVKNSFKEIQNTPIQPNIKTPNIDVTKPLDTVKKASESIMGDVANTATQSATQVEKAAKKASSSVTEVQEKSKKGLFKSDAAKSTFKTIGTLGATVFSGLAIKAAMSLIPLEESSKETFGNMAAMAAPLLGTAFTGVGDILSTSLTEGFERVFKKKMEKRLEGKFEEPMNNLRKKFASIGDPATQSLAEVEKTGSGVFGKIKNLFNKVQPKTEILPDLSKIDPSPLEKMGDVASEVTEKVKKTKNIEELVEKTSKIKETLPEAQDVKQSMKRSIEVPSPEVNTKSAQSKVSGFKDFVSNSFTSLVDVIKKVWGAVKDTLLDVVDFIGNVLKSISGSIGESIKKLLTGIGDGLSSFKTSALKGAAALVVVAGAMWVASKAFQNFAEVSWSDLGKGIIALGGLTLAAMALGKITGQIIIGAAAIAILGAALIPTAYALNQFNEVEWDSLTKAGIALVGLGAAAIPLSILSPLLVASAIGVAAFGGALMVTAIALEKFNAIDIGNVGKNISGLDSMIASVAKIGIISPAIILASVAMTAGSVAVMIFAGSISMLSSSVQGIDPTPLSALGKTLLDLTSISATQLFALSGGIMAVSGAMLAFTGMNLASSVGKGFSNLFGGDSVKDLQTLAELANPLYLAAKSIGALSENLGFLSQTLENVDISNLEKLKEMGSVGVDSKINAQIEPLLNIPKVQRESTEVDRMRISPIQQQLVQPLTPNKAAVAQDIKVQLPKEESTAQNFKIDPIKSFVTQQQASANGGRMDTYEDSVDTIPDTSKTEMLLMQIARLLEVQSKQTLVVQMEGQKVGSILKKGNNN